MRGWLRLPRPLRFLVGGALGFVVDSTVLAALVHLLGANALLARIPSFLLAATATWRFHRHLTFAPRDPGPATLREWARFLFVNGIGNAVNLLAYAVLVVRFGWGPLAALAVASVLAFLLNYLGSARWVFR